MGYEMDFGDFTRSPAWGPSCRAATLLPSGNWVMFDPTFMKPSHHLRSACFSQGKSQPLFPPAALRLAEHPAAHRSVLP